MKIAINGFGRIGRLVYRLMEEDDFFDVVAINDLSSSEELAYLLKYDSTHRNYDKEVTYDDDGIIVNGKKTRIYAEADPSLLPWREKKRKVENLSLLSPVPRGDRRTKEGLPFLPQ